MVCVALFDPVVTRVLLALMSVNPTSLGSSMPSWATSQAAA
jgi:hypothetical protein